MSRKTLLIGCQNFSDSGFGELKSIPNDIDGLTRLLSDPSIGHFNYVENVFNPDLITFKKALGNFMSDVNDDDQILVFISSHAEVNSKTKEFYICFSDTDKNNLFTAISFNEILNFVFSSASKKILILLDVCYSGHATQQINNILKDNKQISILASTQFFMPSWENKDGSGSIFINSIIDGIVTGKADFSRKGYITFKDLYQYLCIQKENNQIPSFLESSIEEFNFCKTPSPQYSLNIDRQILVQFNSKNLKVNNLLQLKQSLNLSLVKVIANVEGGFTDTKDALSFEDLSNQIQISNNNLGILGVGGSGKSFMLRKMFTELSKIKNVLPLYLDMKYNQDTDLFICLWRLIFDAMNVGLTKEDVEEYLKENDTIILIDSLDEISESNKVKFIAQLDKLVIECQVKVVIASRPNEILNQLTIDLIFYKIQNLNITEIKKVLSPELLYFLGSVGILEFASTPLSLSILKGQEEKYTTERPKSKEHLILGYTNELIKEVQSDISKIGYDFNLRLELSKVAADTFLQQSNSQIGNTKVIEVLRKRNLVIGSAVNFPHIELQSAFASYQFAQKPEEYFESLTEGSKEAIVTKDVAVYISIQSQSLAVYFSTYLLEQFLNTNKSIYLIALAKIAKSGNCPPIILKKIINQIVKIYDLQEEKFYPLWEYLRPIVFTWSNEELKKSLNEYLLNEGDLRPIKINVYHHSLPILQDDNLVDWLFNKYDKFLHDRHMIYSILEVMWLRKEVKKEDLLKTRFLDTLYPVERSAILKCLYANNNAQTFKYITGTEIGKSSETALKEKVVRELIEYYHGIQKETQRDQISIDIERGHVIIELSIHNENECNKILSSINFNMPIFKKCTNTLRYHSYYASQNLSKITDFWCIQKN